MEVSVYNQDGKETEKITLPEEIFGVEVNPDLVYQVVLVQMANRRKVVAHTKDRGEVKGGGKKPWRQKGTGRARHGSIRSPIWKGGGVTFGPRKERVWRKSIPKKMSRKAVLMVLSAKVKSNLLLILDKVYSELKKTKQVVSLLDKVISQVGSGKGLSDKNKKRKFSVLILTPKPEKNIFLSSRNISGVKTLCAKDINALDLLSFKYVVMPKETIQVISETFCKR